MVGDVRRVQFWHVVGEVVLKKLFPDLFLIVVGKDASVNYYLEYSEDRGIRSWNLTQWVKGLIDWFGSLTETVYLMPDLCMRF